MYVRTNKDGSAHISRYDPSNMNRITENLADLVNDGSDSDVDDDITDASSVNNKKKKSKNTARDT